VTSLCRPDKDLSEATGVTKKTPITSDLLPKKVWRFYEPEESASLAILLSCTETDDEVTQSDGDATISRLSGSEHSDSKYSSNYSIDSKIRVSKKIFDQLVRAKNQNNVKDNLSSESDNCQSKESSHQSIICDDQKTSVANHNVLLEALSLSSRSDAPNEGKDDNEYGEVILVRSSASDSLAESFEALISDLQALIDKNNNSPKPRTGSETSGCSTLRREDPVGKKLDIIDNTKLDPSRNTGNNAQNYESNKNKVYMTINVQQPSGVTSPHFTAEKTPLVSNYAKNFSFSSKEEEPSLDSANAERVEETINRIKAVLENTKDITLAKSDKKMMTVNTQANAGENTKSKEEEKEIPPPTKVISFSPRSRQSLPEEEPQVVGPQSVGPYHDFTVTSSLTEDTDEEEEATVSESSCSEDSSMFSDDEDIEMEESDESSVDSHPSRKHVPTEIFQLGSNSILQSCSGTNSVLANVASQDSNDENKETVKTSSGSGRKKKKGTKKSDSKVKTATNKVASSGGANSKNGDNDDPTKLALVTANDNPSNPGRACPDGLTAILMNPTLLCRCTGPINTCSPRADSFDDTGREKVLREGNDALKYI
jgi:hypothetical protein